MEELSPLKKIFYKKINKKLSNTNPILPVLTQSYSSRHVEKKMLSPLKNRIDSMETQVTSTTKRLEVDKINLRLLRERLIQKKDILKSFDIKPKKIIIKNQMIKNKLYKPLKEISIINKKLKEEKERQKDEYEFKKETYKLNILIEENNNLRNEIINSRKKRLEMKKIKLKLLKQIIDKTNKLNEIKKVSEHIEKSENIHVLKEEISISKKQEDKFDSIKDLLEEEYNRVIQAYIKKERERAKEIHFNKKIAELKNKSNILKYDLASNKNQEIKKGLGKIEDDQILDRIPILDEALEKWRQVNKTKKESIINYAKNCAKIRETFDKLVSCLNVDSYDNLPEIFEKTQERQSNINIKKEQIENENAKLKKEKEDLIFNIELIQSKKKGNIAYKNKFIEQKKNKILEIDKLIEKFKKDILIKEQFFYKIQPITQKFLKKLNNTYLSEFILNKTDLGKNDKYNYFTVNKYLSNVEDYLNLIYDWEGNNDIDNFEEIENQNFEKLNTEMEKRLENFNRYKLVYKSLANSMQLKNMKGINLKDIIKSESKKIIRPINYNNYNTSKFSKNNKSKEKTTENTEEEYIQFQTDSQSCLQSSIIPK